MMPDSYEDWADQHGGDEPYAVMPCGRYVDSTAEFRRHKKTCRRCAILAAEYRAAMAAEAAAEDAYLKSKYGGAEGPDPLDASQDPRYRE